MSRRALFLAGAALLAACREQPVAPDSAATIWFAATGGEKADYDIQFGGDIESDPFTVTGNANDPFHSLNLDQVILRFVATTGGWCYGTTVPGWVGWGGYGGEPWTGALRIQRKNDFYHVGYQATRGAGFIDLGINRQATRQTETDPVTGKTTTTLTFTNTTAYISRTSTPDGTTTDGGDRCVKFEVKAAMK